MAAAAQERLSVLSPREASIFACLVDTVAAPEPLLPPVAQTDAAFFFDRWMAASPRANATGMRVLLHVIELMPRLMGYGARLRRLPVTERVRYLHAIERNRNPRLRQLTKLVKGAAFLSYYGDDAIMRRLGYDADANLARGRELRAQQGRP
jgi:IS4 transposase